MVLQIRPFNWTSCLGHDNSIHLALMLPGPCVFVCFMHGSWWCLPSWLSYKLAHTPSVHICAEDVICVCTCPVPAALGAAGVSNVRHTCGLLSVPLRRHGSVGCRGCLCGHVGCAALWEPVICPGMASCLGLGLCSYTLGTWVSTGDGVPLHLWSQRPTAFFCIFSLTSRSLSFWFYHIWYSISD